MLFHVSEEAGIERFEPRPSQYAAEPVVWPSTRTTSATICSRGSAPA